jgi:hypothetical protein
MIQCPPQGKSQIFLRKAKYFITILTKSLCGVVKLLFYHYVIFFQQNLHFVGMSFNF